MWDEGTGPQPQCGYCDIFVPQETLVAVQLGTEICRRGVEKNLFCLAANAAWVDVDMDLRVRDQALEKVDAVTWRKWLALCGLKTPERAE